MKIVVVGDGKVGHALTRLLSQAGYDLMVIDSKPHVLQELQETMDVMTIVGNGASLEVQEAADVAHSDLLIAATSADEINILCCMLAKKQGCRHTIARVRNPEYDGQLRYLKEELGLSLAINPERAAAQEIFRILQFPSFLKLDSFAKGRVELVELQIRKGSRLDGIQLFQFYKLTNVKVLVCAVEREGKVTIPSGSFRLQEGDKITVTAATRDLARLIKNLDIPTPKIQNVVLIGGSRIAAYLAKELLASRVSVKIIEKQPERCQILSEMLEDALVIQGNGADPALLAAEQVETADAVVTLTGIDEENLIISAYASHRGVKKTVTKINNMEYADIFQSKGVDSVVSPKAVAANDIVRYVRAMDNTENAVLTLHRIVGDKAEALEFAATEDTWNLGVSLSELNLKDNLLIACINRGGKIIIPTGSDSIEAGDTVIVVTTVDQTLNSLNDIFKDLQSNPAKREELL